MILRAGLTLLWLACFGSFATARGRQFTGEPTRPMRLTAAMGLGVSLGQLAALLVRAIGWSAAPAAALYLAALVLFWWSARATRARALGLGFGGEPPTHLVTAGPFRLVRHPYYLSYLLYWTAGALAVGTIWGWPPVLLMAFLYHRAATHEEAQFATSDLADAYGAYCRRTGAFWPRIPTTER